ncbi:AI-2E family transporter [uncultured Georgenia sp.]|uniref:AI-2E family transporter n=1 Tax=uncultured Georgenia sp. TaxID=378209 RepID=UPI00262EFEC7|nr:AI-2E family transporter [uncultured Georgenia sp.]HLV03496.1 AI-2E family transporter [Actinomycetaceae bacterium]
MAPDDAAVVTWGRRAWTAIGVILLAVGLVYVASQVSLVLTPFVLALFPAALLDPVAARLRATRIPDAVVALLILLVLFAVVVAAGAFIGAALVDQVPQIVDAVVAGLDRLETSVDWSVLPGDVGGLRDLVTGAGAALTSGAALSRGLLAAEAVGSFVTGLVLMVVVLFFFLKDGRRIWQAFLDLVPSRYQARVDAMAAQSFWTLGAFFRAQLLVALVDAVFIGLGLLLLRVPLVLPLSVLVFVGGLFPIVGAFLSGTVAVAVALADRGPVVALAVLGVVVLVQQLEGNVLEPYIQARIISLHPLVIILAVTTGGILMGILGAFLAVPVAAVVARLLDHLRGRPPAAGPADDGPEPA